MNAILTTNQVADVPSIARVVLSLGLLGALLANLQSQVPDMHFAEHGGIALPATDWSAWFHLQFLVGAALVAAGLRWRPHASERSAA
ncbi:hypothetical protein [Lysobacter solisilvae (ex Woo and Kim 2020)]|uniref:Uncharacterized protein n=1 Tax=Agrilutibacter terrestris TaxID=2865112 RepID=A0A7H0FXM2_9GAMM|nr:hypothetical protein [Lysobacter terrestris]QNP40788.1 hypothetical protein H8B22_00525 [Lysobacter terrestris]